MVVLDDDASMLWVVERLARECERPICLTSTTTADAALEALRKEHDSCAKENERVVLLSDYDLRAERTGLDVLVEAAKLAPRAGRILMSGHDRERFPADLSPYAERFLPKENIRESFAALFCS